MQENFRQSTIKLNELELAHESVLEKSDSLEYQLNDLKEEMAQLMKEKEESDRDN